MALPARNRLSLRQYRSSLEKTGSVSHTQHLTIISSPSLDHLPYPRFAILISKKTARLAVDRNRLRRVLTSSIQADLSRYSPFDFLIIPRPSALNEKNIAVPVL